MSQIKKSTEKMLLGMPPFIALLLCNVASALTGGLSALAIYYVLYRIGLPTTPFIYVAF